MSHFSRSSNEFSAIVYVPPDDCRQPERGIVVAHDGDPPIRVVVEEPRRHVVPQQVLHPTQAREAERTADLRKGDMPTQALNVGVPEPE